MNAPFWFPQSFFARTLWMVLIVVLFSKVLTLVYLMMNEDVLFDRQYSHGAALTVRAYWAAPEADRPKIAEAAGLRIAPRAQVPDGEHHWPYSDIFARQMQDELGPETQVRLRALGSPALWVHAPSLGPDWLRVPMYPSPLRGQRIWNVLGWFLAIGLLSTAAAWIFVRMLNAPLKRLVFAARQVGRGRSVRLPISDTPSELTEVYRAFNQMAADVEKAASERELMLAGVSHDLRTPLTRLRLSLELLGTDSELTEDMVRDIEDMDAILDQFLAFIRDGRDEPVEDLDLAELVRETVAPYNQQREQVQLAVQAGIPPVPLRRPGGARRGAAGRRSGRALRAAERAGPWPRPGGARAERHLQSLHPWRPRPGRHRHRAGPGDRQAHRRIARRPRGTAQPRRRRTRSAGVPAAGAAAAARGRLSRESRGRGLARELFL